jgi:hypothetical protein
MNSAEMKQVYRSPNGDQWFLGSDPVTGLAFVRHQANASSGGQSTDIEIGAFLNEPHHPEHEALLRLIGGTLVPDAPGAITDDEQPLGSAGKEWSDAELSELGDMLVRELSMQEIARVLRRDLREIHDKVVEIGRAWRYGWIYRQL